MQTETVRTETRPEDASASPDESTPLFDEIVRRTGASWLHDGAETENAAAPPEQAAAHAKPKPSESDGQASAPASS